MPDVYDPGDQAELVHVFRDPTGTAADPTTVTLRVFTPAGTSTDYVYPTDLTKETTGRYRRLLDLSGAAAGLWLYEWIGEGTVIESTTGFFTVTGPRLLELVREVRMGMHDFPKQAYVVDAPLTAGATTLTLGSVGEIAQFQSADIFIEFDDPTGEVAVTSGAGDQELFTVPIRRAQMGTTAQDHAQGTPVLKAPRFRWPQITRALFDIIELELWPHVWILGEFDLAFNSSIDLYPVPVPGVTELVYAYQHLPNQGRTGVALDMLSPEFASGSEFRDGAISVRSAYAPGTIHVSYRAKPEIGNLDRRTRALAVLGAKAMLQMDEESVHVGPSATAIEGRVGDGAKLRAGLLAWQRFTESRAKQLASLLQSESALRKQLARQVS